MAEFKVIADKGWVDHHHKKSIGVGAIAQTLSESTGVLLFKVIEGRVAVASFVASDADVTIFEVLRAATLSAAAQLQMMHDAAEAEARKATKQ